ncbi:MAG: hypothetical protein GEU99_06945 [Luteitalea sp.]|nr:hypothetical protein [Luteitalea sp.]
MTQTTHLFSRTTVAVILGFALCVGAAPQAQEPVPAEPQEPPGVPAKPAEPTKAVPPSQQPAPRHAGPQVTATSRNVNVEVTVTQQLGGAPVSKTLTFVVADSSTGKVRSGIKVPIANAMPNMGMNYQDVGFDVDAGIRILDNDRIWLDLSLTFSSVLPAKGSGKESQAYPSFGNAESQLNLLLDNGKPLTLTQSGDPSTGQEYAVEVKATIIE